MPLPTSLDAVAQELGLLMEETTAFINRETGEISSVSHDDMALAEEEDLDETALPAWQAEMLPQIREIVTGENWLPLPGKFEIHEWEIMRQFADSVDDDELSERLQEAIHGRGAFRMFRATVEDFGLRQAWFAFKHQALRRIALEALEELGIPYR